MPGNYVPFIPDELASRLRYFDDGFHASGELKGNVLLDQLFASYSEQTGKNVIPCTWYQPVQFEQRFGIKRSAYAEEIQSTGSWVMDRLRDMLQRAMEKKVTDIHVVYMGPYAQVFFRRLGLVMEQEPMSGDEGLQFIRGIFQSNFSQAESGWSETERYDGRIADRKLLPEGLIAVRLHSEPIQSQLLATPGVALVMRLLFDATEARGSLKERLGFLGYTARQREIVHGFTEKSGLSIVAGPTGSGKTTVLKNILEALARDVPTKAYWSLEDPPEYPILGVRQLNVHTKAVSDAERQRALLEAIAGLMRSDPDVILVGEIRYEEAARAAINAALTGHAIWSTVHANSAIGIIARLHEMGSGIPLASICTDGVLTGLIYQRLVPILCPICKRKLIDSPGSASEELWARLRTVYRRGEIDGIFVRGDEKDCLFCDGIGLKGQQVVAEVVPVSSDRHLVSLMRENNLWKAQQYWVKEMRGLTHVAHALERIASGDVDPSIAEARLGLTLDHDLEAGGAKCLL